MSAFHLQTFVMERTTAQINLMNVNVVGLIFTNINKYLNSKLWVTRYAPIHFILAYCIFDVFNFPCSVKNSLQNNVS